MNRKVEMKPFYREVTKRPSVHARLLNTFSYLEYIGFRKIVKSQLEADVSLSVLAHASEESRHALILKKMAVRLASGTTVESYAEAELLCGDAAHTYFQVLDQTIFAELKIVFAEKIARRLSYLYVTWLIEIRALEVYSDYVDVLAESKLSSPLEALMAEEDRHLEFVSEFLHQFDVDFLSRSVHFKNIEYKLFSTFFESLQNAIKEETVLGTFPLSAAVENPGGYEAGH